jgi:pimeloyl-ACP methyl ester carboxylesterase
MSSFVEGHEFEPIFTKKAGYLRIYIDLPRMGDSQVGRIEDLDSILESVSSVVEKLILPSNFLLIGTSCGAYLACALAYRYASAIDGLLLRIPLVEPVTTKRDIDPFMPAIPDEALLSSPSSADCKTLGDIPVQTLEYVDIFRRKLKQMVLPTIAASDSATLDSIRNDPNLYKLTAPLHSPESPFLKPALILTGRQATDVGYRDAWPLVACYPRATFVTLDRSNHDLPVNETDLFEALVDNWLWRVEELRRQALPPGSSSLTPTDVRFQRTWAETRIVTYGIAYALTVASFAIVFIPVLWLFLHGIERGMDHIDRVYPYPQARKPLHDHPALIYIHMYANIMALGLQISLLHFHPPTISKVLHGGLAWTYTILVTTGTLASIAYASKQSYGSDGGKSGTFAFGVMALATFGTLATSLYYVYIQRDVKLHREWSLRNFAVLFGNGIVFRLLANTYLVYMIRWGADFYSTWCQMIYLSWLLPLFATEQYLAWERSTRLVIHSVPESAQKEEI